MGTLERGAAHQGRPQRVIGPFGMRGRRFGLVSAWSDARLRICSPPGRSPRRQCCRPQDEIGQTNESSESAPATRYDEANSQSKKADISETLISTKIKGAQRASKAGAPSNTETAMPSTSI